MKKTLVFVLVAAMLVSMLSVSASAYFSKAANSGKVKADTYVAKTEWNPDGVIDAENGEYYPIALTANDISYLYHNGAFGDTYSDHTDGVGEAIVAEEIKSLSFYTSWNGSDTVYFAATFKPHYLDNTLVGSYSPARGLADGNTGDGDEFACNTAVILCTGVDLHHTMKSQLGNNNILYMAYAQFAEDGEVNPAYDDKGNRLPFDGMVTGSYEPQFGASNKYQPIGKKDYFVKYDFEAGTVTFEISVPTAEAFGNANPVDGDKFFFNFEMICGEPYETWSGEHIAINIGDFGFFFPGTSDDGTTKGNPGNQNCCATMVLHNGQPEGWGADEPADDTTAAETTAAETTAADTTAAETTAADTTKAEETTKKQDTPVNPTTADITVLCLAAAASAIAVISKKRK